jgi:glutamyl-tRNA synthetase
MIQFFELTDINKAPSAFNPEKLLWLNQHYLKSSDPAHVARHLSWHMGQLNIDPGQGPALTEIVKAFRERAKTLQEMAQASAFFYQDFAAYDETAAKKHLTAEAKAPLLALHTALAKLPQWQGELIHATVQQTAEQLNLKLGKIAQPLRVAVSGKAVSPPIDITLTLLGRDKTLQRIERAVETLGNN